MIWRLLAKYWAKVIILGTLVAVSIYVSIYLLGKGMYIPAAMPLIGSGLISYIFLSSKRYPLRWLVPGLIFLAVMVAYPIGYTFVSSFTNVGTGHMLSRTQAVDQLLGRTYAPADAQTYSYAAFANEAGELALVLTAEGESLLYVAGEASSIQLSDSRFLDQDGDGSAEAFGEYRRLSIAQIVPRLSELETYAIDFEGAEIGLRDLNTWVTRAPLYEYDETTSTMTDLTTGVLYKAVDGIFTAEDGSEIYPGYRVGVGLRNYARLLTNPQIAGPFAKVFIWTFVFALLTTILNFSLGLGTAVLLNDPFLRFRTLYRVLMVIPYALPGFITILVWRGMLNESFGIINVILTSVFGAGARVKWLTDPMWAKTSILLVNLWLGYPYMMLISLGSLQSIPGSLYEAAKVDGARWWQQFWRITLPLLLMPLGPLLVGTFAFNFNNFTLIYLLTEGGPPIAGSVTPAGATDILISYTYNLAFQGDRGNQLGLAAAVSVLIFLIIGTISAINFRMTGALEELSKNV